MKEIDQTTYVINFLPSFLVGDNGVYEGTGWHVKAGTSSFKSNSTGIAFVGDFSGELFL